MTEGSGESNQAKELQFDKVELASPSASRVCPSCQRVISDEYYEVNGHVICASCAGELASGKGGAALLRALVFGAGAAIIGTVGWYLITLVTKSQWGIVAIAVGFFVGMAVRRGSRVGGGWRYQALAMLLTYFSITASRVPEVIEAVQAQAETVTANVGTPTVGAADDNPKAVLQPTRDTPSFGVVGWLFVFAIALASPFLAGTSGIIGLIIIGIALYEAWKLNRRVPVNGPFRFGLAPATT